MILTWKTLHVSAVIVDGRSYAVNTDMVEIELNKGPHTFEILLPRISVPELRKKLLANFLSDLCGAVVYTIKDAIADTYDNKVSFQLTVDDDNMLFNLEDHIFSHEVTRTKAVDIKKLNLVRRLYILPFTLLGGVLGAAFLTLGIIAIRSGQVGGGIFSVVISALSFALTVGLVVKTRKMIASGG